METMTKVKIGVGIGVTIAGLFVAYEAYIHIIKPILNAVKAVEDVVGGASSAAQNAAGAVWNARPKILFKGVEPEDDLALLQGLIQ